jgi:undecaprenyl-diphosphatase
VTWSKHRISGAPAALLAFARSEAVLLAAMAVIAGSALGFIGIADAMAEGDTRAFDWAVLRMLHPGPDEADPAGPAWFDAAVADFTALGSISVLSTLSLGVAGFLVLMRRSLEATLLALALGGALALSEVLKAIFGRDRPPDAWRAIDAVNASFPSGHALLSAVVYLTLGAMLARSVAQRALRVYVMVAAILLAILVGLSRAWLGVHWMSDVLAGWCAGAAWAAACWLLDRWLRKRYP